MDGSGSAEGGTLQRSDRRSVEIQIPPPIRQTVEQLMDLADETELRALTLEWMTRSFRIGDTDHHKEQTLLQITDRLRHMAERLRAEDRPKPADRDPSDVRSMS